MKATRLNVLLKTAFSTILAAVETMDSMPDKITDEGDIKVIQDTIDDLKKTYAKLPKENCRFVRSEITAVIKELETKIEY